MSVDRLVLSLRQVTRRRGRGPESFLLEVPSFDVPRGACLALTGASGCGKSTMLDLLGLVLRPDQAESFALAADGLNVDVAALWRDSDDRGLAAARARLIGYVLQTGGLLPFLNAAGNIRLSPRLLGRDPDEEWISRLVETLSLGSLLRKKPKALSIGERQRVAIARALAHRPALLLADEPTASLDPVQGIRVMELLLGLVRDVGLSAVLVTHDWDLVKCLGLEEVRAQPSSSGLPGAMRFVC